MSKRPQKKRTQNPPLQGVNEPLPDLKKPEPANVDRAAALIAFATINPYRLGPDRVVSTSVQRAALIAVYPYRGEVQTLAYIAGVVGCDDRTAQGAMQALEAQGFVVAEASGIGRAKRYRIDADALARTCEPSLTCLANDEERIESRAKAESTWEAVVGVPIRPWPPKAGAGVPVASDAGEAKQAAQA
jgi:hypothetical protein